MFSPFCSSATLLNIAILLYVVQVCDSVFNAGNILCCLPPVYLASSVNNSDMLQVLCCYHQSFICYMLFTQHIFLLPLCLMGIELYTISPFTWQLTCDRHTIVSLIVAIMVCEGPAACELLHSPKQIVDAFLSRKLQELMWKWTAFYWLTQQRCWSQSRG